MTTSSEIWASLDKSTTRTIGAAWSRVAPQSGHDLFIAVKQPGSFRSLWYDVPADALPRDFTPPALQSVAVDVHRRHDEPAVLRCELTLERSDLRDVFGALVDDIVNAIERTQSHDAGISALLNRLERWHRLLQPERRSGLTTLERRGLYGELHILHELLTRGTPSSIAVSYWTGPYGAHQDFQAKDSALEIKSSVTKQPQSLVIASERELDDTGVASLYLAHLSLDERRDGSGQSLNAIADEIRSKLDTNSHALSGFEDALLHVGLLPEHRSLYDAPFYSIRDVRMFSVATGFPRIIEKMLPVGVGDVVYRVQIAALMPYAVAISTVYDCLGGEA
jgi:hypothetical protein